MIQVPPLSLDDSFVLLTDRFSDRGAADLVDAVGRDLLLEACRRVDGIPLAIELLAGRVAFLGDDRLVERLDALPTLLTSADQGRHGGLASALASSFEALSDEPREAIMRLSVCAGGFSLDAARALLPGTDGESEQAVEALVGASLVWRDGQRYRMLEPIRQYALEAADQHGIRDDADRSLVAWTVALARDASWGSWLEPLEWRPRLEDESRNIDAALAGARRLADTEGPLRILAGLGNYWGTTHPEAAFRRANEILQSASPHVPDRRWAWALIGAGTVASFAQQTADADTWLQEATELFTRLDESAGEMVARFFLGRLRNDAEELYRARQLADASDSQYLGMWIRALEANLLRQHGEHARALDLITEARDISDRQGLPALGIVEHIHAVLLADQGRCLDEAAACCEAAITAFRAGGDSWNEILAVGLAAHLAVRQHDLAGAVKLLTTQIDLTDDFGVAAVAGTVALNVAALGWLCNHQTEATALARRARSLVEVATDADALEADRTILHDVPPLLLIAQQTRPTTSVDYQPVLVAARSFLADLQHPASPQV